MFWKSLAARAGLQVGDTTLSVNGHPVAGFANLDAIFQAVRRDLAFRFVQAGAPESPRRTRFGEGRDK